MLRVPECIICRGRILGYPVLLTTVVAIGVYLRAYDFFVSPLSLWYDEAWRASSLLSSGGLFHAMIKGQSNIDPILFNVGVYLLAKLYNTESVLRLISLVPSLFSIVLTYLLARRFTNERWIVFWAVFVVSVHPTLIDYARELKPYALGLCTHLAVLMLYFKFRDAASISEIALFTVILGIAYFASSTIVFLFPALYLSMMVRRLRERDVFAVKLLLLTAGMLLVCIGGVAFYQIRYIPVQNQVVAFGETFNVTDTFFWYVRWAVQHYFTVIQYVLMPIDLMEVRPVMGFAYICLYIGALSWMIYDKNDEALALLFTPILILILFNRFGLWPWGFTRTNLFTFGYILLAGVYGLNRWFAGFGERKNAFLMAFVALVVITQFPYHMDKLKKKSFGRSEIKPSLNLFYERAKASDGPIVLIHNAMARPQFKYYAFHHRDFSRKYASLTERITLIGLQSRMPVNIREALPEIYGKYAECWIVLAHYDQKEKIALTDPRFVEIVEEKKFNGSWAVHVKSKMYRS